MLYLALYPAHACPDTAPTVTGRSAVIMHFTGNEGQAGTVTWKVSVFVAVAALGKKTLS